MFENHHSIYLHDTPYKGLFAKDIRAFSHGCIREKDAKKVADLLLYTENKHNRSMSYYLKKGYPEKA